MPLDIKEREGPTAPTDVLKMRSLLQQAADAGRWTVDPPSKEIFHHSIRLLSFGTPSVSKCLILHLHGGGFRAGSPETSSHFAKRISQNCQVTVLCPGYRLAPEHPFPSGLLDCRKVLQYAVQQHPDLPVILSGDSAGGGLAASLALLAAEHKIPIAGVILLSPWLDLRLVASTFQSNATSDKLFSYQTARLAADFYLQGTSPENPYVSPLLADLSRFPPTLLCTGDIEVLVEDSRAFANTLQHHNVDVRYHEISGMGHTAVIRDITATGAEQTAGEIESFINAFLAGDSFFLA